MHNNRQHAIIIPKNLYNIYMFYRGEGGNEQRLLPKLIQNTNSYLGSHEIPHFY